MRKYDVPLDRHYEKTHHLWALQDAATGRVRVGIDAIGLESLGELAFVSLHDTDTRVSRGDAIGSLEAAKMTTSIAAPISGTIAARNNAVLRDPMLVNSDPYGDGWLLEIEPSRWDTEAALLVSGDAIAGWVAAETERLQAEPPLDSPLE